MKQTKRVLGLLKAEPSRGPLHWVYSLAVRPMEHLWGYDLWERDGGAPDAVGGGGVF